jgi:hypothetical protein
LLNFTSIFGNRIVSESEYKTLTYQQLVQKNKRVVIIGSYTPQPTHEFGSFYYTENSNWENVITKGMEWLKGNGSKAIKDGKIATLEASVTPVFLSKSPNEAAPLLNAKFNTEIAALTKQIVINVIQHDYVSQDLIETVINHNKKF